MSQKKFDYLPKKIAILYTDAKREYFNTEAEYITESYLYNDAVKIVPYFEHLNFKVDVVPANEMVVNYLEKNKPLFVLNLADTIRGREDLGPTVPAVLDMLGISYLGTGTEGLIYDRNRFLSHVILEKHGIPVPGYQLIEEENFVLNSQLQFPLISKLNMVHGSIEIDESAVSENIGHLQERITKLISIYNQPIIVEKFIHGKELTAMVLESNDKTDGLEVYVAEKVFHDRTKYLIDTYIGKWGEEDIFEYKKVITKGTSLEKNIKAAFKALKMNDYGKFDIRQDTNSGEYYIIDCNANPAFGPLECNCAISNVLKLHDVNFDYAIKKIVGNLLQRIKQNVIS